VKLREGEIQEVLKEMSKRIKDAMEREKKSERRKKGIVGEIKIAKKKR